MFRDIFSTRLLIVGFVFFALVAVGAQLYSWYVRRTTEAVLERHDQFLQELENKNEIRPVQAVNLPTENKTLGETPEEIDEPQMSDDMDVLPIDEASEFAEVADAFLPDDFVSEAAPTEDVPVSPFGFGPYPEIPDDFPEPDIFESLASMGDSDMRKALELQKRLIIEFWKRGKSLENVGVTGDADGKVYLLYPDVVYVTWDYWTDENGTTHRYAGVTRGHPDTAHIYESYLDKGEIPPGITVYEFPDGYIDAYEFLGLTR